MKKTANISAQKKLHQAIYPPPAKKGDTIGLVAPAGPLINKDNFTTGIKILEENGFKVKFNRKLLNSRGYLAGSDQERADEFNSLWADPKVKALVAIRGGYGCLRMIDLVDFKLIRKTPKILIGFSDLTVLLNAIHKKTGLVTYHGPVITTLADINKKSEKSFFDILTGKSHDRIKPTRIKTLKDGRAKGVLMGGNLTTLAHTIGTPYEVDWNNTILFIEDVGELPYRLDRMLTQIERAGRLQKIKGLILGSFNAEKSKNKTFVTKTVYKRVTELLAENNIPIWANFPIGHGRYNMTLPIGSEVEIDTYSNTLKFLNSLSSFDHHEI